MKEKRNDLKHLVVSNALICKLNIFICALINSLTLEKTLHILIHIASQDMIIHMRRLTVDQNMCFSQRSHM